MYAFNRQTRRHICPQPPIHQTFAPYDTESELEARCHELPFMLALDSWLPRQYPVTAEHRMIFW